MQPFRPIALPLRLRAEARSDRQGLNFLFELEDPRHLVAGWATHEARFTERELVRADELWRETCMEAFFGAPGTESYFELNLSPNSPRWNLYAFAAYRQPQPPRPSDALRLTALALAPKRIEARIEGTLPAALEGNLCAVVKMKSGDTHFFAALHGADRPDFHARAGFAPRWP